MDRGAAKPTPGEGPGRASAKGTDARGAPRGDPADRFADAVRRAAGRQEGEAGPKADERAGDGSTKPGPLGTEPERREVESGALGRGASADTSEVGSSPRTVGAATAPISQPLAAAAQPGLAAAEALLPKLAPLMPQAFSVMFPPNAWPLIRAEGSRGPNGLNLRLTAADAKDEARLKSAISSLREALEGAGHVIGAITVLTDGE